MCSGCGAAETKMTWASPAKGRGRDEPERDGECWMRAGGGGGGSDNDEGSSEKVSVVVRVPLCFFRPPPFSFSRSSGSHVLSLSSSSSSTKRKVRRLFSQSQLFTVTSCNKLRTFATREREWRIASGRERLREAKQKRCGLPFRFSRSPRLAGRGPSRAVNCISLYSRAPSSLIQKR